MEGMSHYDYVLVGAGFFCAVLAERIANDLGKKVLLVEKRKHLGGNCYSAIDPITNIEYHAYGTHVFHTSNREVWEYLHRFTTFNHYYHQVLSTWNGKVYQMPINLETINSFYGLNLKPFEVPAFLKQELGKENYAEPANFEQQAINLVGRPLYEALLKGYTIKQWGRQPSEIPASVVKRLPFRHNYRESYFNDPFQGIPTDGYTRIFEKMLHSDNITLQLDTDFFDIRGEIDPRSTVIYSGAIDRLFDYKYGDLAYRSLSFEQEIMSVDDYQGTSVMNYANEEIPYTRIHEPKHLHPEREHIKGKTLVIKEFSVEANRENPYYPVGGAANQVIYQQYQRELAHHPTLIVGGRLGDYRYYDMHHVIAQALNLYQTQLKPKHA